MFDIGFSELLLCFLVALVVLGPERLPKVARTVGRWTGQAKGYLRNLTAELDREAELSELRAKLEEAKRAMQEGAQSFRDTVQKEASNLHDAVKKETDAARESVRKAADDANGKP
ncbi:Sec-independent protein translocase protein TatB [Solimonas terrae]|uniref:Sec-independent protein translocase protein TatB n=1 Tax=Solimonas terrae TaxID=1396819 RepID=A0A6M2BV79_9GAMM|nr:Sec-independent protein translocase protein TatB [Solimonas terrae]NGY06552.1 twin-arginine translocase subunit TatB [Solimonas terrae]